ncbi:MAG: DUF6516 family protein [Candidatus Doudnabacteria bacterium]|nr:DUF6516 family protein [Candidatus Doudnabacteria bacterium]
MSLRDYLDAFHQAIGKIDDYGFAESIAIKEEIRPAKQAIINAKIDLVDGSVVQIRVYIDGKYKVEVLSYAYQYHDAKGKLIFRYDNACHKPELGFKDHKHQYDGSMVQSTMPDISDVVDEVIKYI